MKALFGRKIRMMQVFTETGEAVPCTAVQVEPCTVVQVKTEETDGYRAAQVGFRRFTKRRGANKPLNGHFAKFESEPFLYLREVRLSPEDHVEPRQMLDASLFQEGDRLDVTGLSRGKGFQGGVKRHNWRGGPGAHGAMFHRAPGSIGASAYPSRVFKGHGMPGRMGHRKTTVHNLRVMKVDEESGILFIRGAVPGAPGTWLYLRPTNRASKQKED